MQLYFRSMTLGKPKQFHLLPRCVLFHFLQGEQKCQSPRKRFAFWNIFGKSRKGKVEKFQRNRLPSSFSSFWCYQLHFASVTSAFSRKVSTMPHWNQSRWHCSGNRPGLLWSWLLSLTPSPNSQVILDYFSCRVTRNFSHTPQCRSSFPPLPHENREARAGYMAWSLERPSLAWKSSILSGSKTFVFSSLW